MLYDGEQYPMYETCPKCKGDGRLPSEDSDPYNSEPPGVTFACLKCMGAGRAPSKDIVVRRLSGYTGQPRYAARYLTRREKIIGFLQLAWPPDIENPRHGPYPGDTLTTLPRGC